MKFVMADLDDFSGRVALNPACNRFAQFGERAPSVLARRNPLLPILKEETDDPGSRQAVAVSADTGAPHVTRSPLTVCIVGLTRISAMTDCPATFPGAVDRLMSRVQINEQAPSVSNFAPESYQSSVW